MKLYQNSLFYIYLVILGECIKFQMKKIYILNYSIKNTYVLY